MTPRPRSPFTAEEDAKLAELAADDVSEAATARRMGRNRSSVRERAIKLGVAFRRTRWPFTPQEHVYMAERRAQGESWFNIALELDRHTSNVHRYAQRVGLAGFVETEAKKDEQL